MYQLRHKRTARNSSKPRQNASFAPRPFAIQAKQAAHHATEDDLENAAFRQNKLESLELQCKQAQGTLTPVERENLGVLQAKMDDFWVQRQHRTGSSGYNLANIPIHSLEHSVSPTTPSRPGPLVQRQVDSKAKRQTQLISPLQPATIQRAHKKGANRKIEAKQNRNAAKRNRKKQEAEQQQQDAEEWSNTVSSWASWAWESAKSIGTTVIKKASGGIDPLEVAATLQNAYKSNASITTKIQYLALYGSYQVSTYLTANMATLVGGDVGAMMEMEDEINGHIEALSNLWETGEIEEGQVQERIADQILEALG